MAPVAAAIALSFRRIARTVTQRARRVTARINAQIQESVSGIMVAKAFRRAHRILVLEQGQIVEEGTHGSLLAQGGYYADLYNAYFRHQSLEYVESLGARA